MTTAVSPCVHVWDIEPANGPTSKGACTRCGETREFANSLPEEEEPGERHQLQLGRIPETRAEGKARGAEAIEQIRIRKEATNMAQKQSTGARRIRQLAETKHRFFEMVAENRSVAEIEAMLNEAPGGPPSGTAVRHWWEEAKKRAGTTSHIVEVAVPITTEAPANIPGNIPEESGDDPLGNSLWTLVMEAAPPFSDKPRLGRWMDMVDAVYAFLVECDHDGVQG